MRGIFTRRAVVTQALSMMLLAVARQSKAQAEPIAPCRPKANEPASFAALVNSTPIIDIHCHIFNATDIPAYQFLQNVVSLKAFSDAYLSDHDKESIYQLKNGEWKKFYKESREEFEDILDLIRENEWIDNSYPLDRLLLTPGYHQEVALLDDISSSKGDHADIEKRFIRSVLKRHSEGDNSSYARNWFRYSAVDWRGPRLQTKQEIDAVARRMKIQNNRLRGGFQELRGIKRFLGCMVRTRVENFLALKETYTIEGTGKESPVKFFTPALVDFDYWLGGPSARAAANDTPSLIQGMGTERARFNEAVTIKRQRTSIDQQVKLMGHLSQLFPAECHAYFPFCPWRQVDLSRPNSPSEAPLKILKRAIKDHGFIGVKLYPAMGFRPRHNYLVSRHGSIDFPMFPKHLYDQARFGYLPERKPAQSEQDWQFDVSEAFGRLLDEALSDLFVFCNDNNVPIMTHAGPSNFAGGYDVFEDGSLRHNFYSEKGAIEYWHKMIKDPSAKCGGLRLNLAHAGFGNKYWGQQLIEALSDDNQIYADISYFEKILSGTMRDPCADADRDATKLSNALDSHKGLAKRFMYGSDWYMMTQENFSDNYLDVVSKVLLKHVKDEITFKAVMAGNASRFLGLTLKENSNYERLNAFYDRSFGPNSRRAREARSKLDRLAAVGLETA